MSKVIKLRKGLDILLEGVAKQELTTAAVSELYALIPSDYIGVTPKPLIKEGEAVKAGTPVFFDKENPSILFTSPVSGTLKEIVRGEKRKILAFTIVPDGKNESVALEVPKNPTAEQVKEFLLNSGLWTTIIQRPFGIIARPEVAPRDIYVSTFDSSPLAPDTDFTMAAHKAEIEKAVELLSKIAPVHVGVKPQSKLADIKGATVTTFEGKHPVGNVGVQISNTKPVAKGETVWTIDVQHMAIIGRAVMSGKLDMTKTVAVVGSQINKAQYVKCISGASITSLTKGNVKQGNTRLLSGNPLTGFKSDYLGFYNNQITAIPEGDVYEFVGWAMPRPHRLSFSRGYFSWLTPKKKYNLDTNLNGGERAFVVTGIYEEVLPMDIYPMYLLKAVMSGDIDKMENLGIYEVVEEDLALCEFICPSKIEWQATLRDGITKMIKEL